MSQPASPADSRPPSPRIRLVARRLLRPVFWLCTLGWLALPATAVPLTGTRPNILLVMTDDQGYGELGCHGNPILKTPNLDRLHAQSLRFTGFHVSPTCAPTRSALLTGRHEFHNGVTHTIFERERLDPAAITVAQALRDAGYATGIFGKWHLGDEDAYLPGRRGFDDVFIHGGGGIGQSYPGSCGDAPANRYHDPVVWHNGRFERTQGYCTDVFLGEAARWIGERRGTGQPFFAYVTPNAPHDPFVIPGEEWAAPYRGRGLSTNAVNYYAMIAHFDAALGQLLAKLDEWNLATNTLVIFLTDNGHSVGDVFNAGMRGLKGTPYEGGTRVPSFWRLPGRLPAGTDCAALTAHVDVFATLAGFAGLGLGPYAHQVEGRSLLPLLENPAAPWPDRLLVTHQGRWEAGEAVGAKYRATAIRDARFKLVNGTELYDLAADPGEQHDVGARHPQVAGRLRAAFDAWWDEVLPATVANEQTLGPYVNPFAERYWRQFGDDRTQAQLDRMNPAWKFVRPRPTF